VKASAFALFLALVTAVGGVTAADLQDLVDGDHLRIDGHLSPAQGLVPGQKVRLVLEVATDSWFTGGTRITPPEVPGLVILQTEQFAANASENRDGRSWVIQRWTLDVFPQRAGDFTIPPVRMLLRVSDGASGTVEGTLSGPALTLSAAIPDALADLPHWVAAPAFSVGQTFDRELDTLAVGDAVERSIRFEASDVMAMMLPSVEPQRLAGLGTYPAPPELDNRVNRGEALATRTERVSYVAEQPGEYLLPELEFFWWNTRDNALELVTLPETRIAVGGAVANDREDRAAPEPRRAAGLIAALLCLVAAGYGVRWLLRRLPRQRLRATLLAWRTQVAALFRPALPERLNPGSSAGD